MPFAHLGLLTLCQPPGGRRVQSDFAGGGHVWRRPYRHRRITLEDINDNAPEFTGTRCHLYLLLPGLPSILAVGGRGGWVLRGGTLSGCAGPPARGQHGACEHIRSWRAPRGKPPRLWVRMCPQFLLGGGGGSSAPWGRCAQGMAEPGGAPWVLTPRK